MSLRRWMKNRAGRAQGFGGCKRCGDTWNWKPEHITNFLSTRQGDYGCFPLCEECWQELVPIGRLPYYALLAKQWIDEAERVGRQDMVAQYATDWPEIQRSVLAGA